jgi:hypothetical protein
MPREPETWDASGVPEPRPILPRVWGALLVIFGLWLAMSLAMSVRQSMAGPKPPLAWVAEALGLAVCFTLLYLGYSLWVRSRAVRQGALTLIGLAAAGVVLAAINGAIANGIVGFVLFGFLGGVSLLLAKANRR